MQVVRSIADIRRTVQTFRSVGEKVGLVPTMGALHEGHLTLIRAAKRENTRVVATVFVNPTQFGDAKDLEKYPRTEGEDVMLLEAEGVDAVFIPDVATMYPEGDETIVETTKLANMLHGQVRPGHYRGVCTVVTKLFNIVGPDAAYFGEKDYQQLAIIRRMVADLFLPLRVVGVPTVREADGLAMSSRNRRLTPEDRAAAVVLSKALDKAEEVAKGGRIAEVEAALRTTINSERRASLRAVDIVDPVTLQPVQGEIKGRIAVMLSAQFGDVLLIDQREIG